jgi:hypothetical protein
LQYRAWQSTNEYKKDSFNLLAADAFLNEGDYQSAVNLNERIKDIPGSRDMKAFINGKAEFFNENAEGSLSFLEMVNKNALNEDYKKELSLFKCLDHIHLFEKEKAIGELAIYLAENGKDTVGLRAEFFEIKVPKQYNIRKARKKASIFPGSGLYYVGEKNRAFGSFFANLLFLGYTGYSIYTKHYITATLTGAMQFLRFYNGGKRASVKIGSRKNREAYILYIMHADEFVQKKFFDMKN